jgi:5,10-methenyltetrahydromethanopterin hydrogenase
MSLFMKDPKKTATLIIEAMKTKKAPQTSDGAVKDALPANSDQASRLLEAIKSSNPEAFMNSLRSFVKDVMNESTDEKPEVPSEEI